MSDDIFRFGNSIMDTKEYLDTTGYNAFFTNRQLSQHIDCILLVNDMNMAAHLPAVMQYDFLFHSVRKMKRSFGKWGKKKESDDIQTIMDYYDYSFSKARAVLPCLTKKQIGRMNKLMDRGG